MPAPDRHRRPLAARLRPSTPGAAPQGDVLDQEAAGRQGRKAAQARPEGVRGDQEGGVAKVAAADQAVIDYLATGTFCRRRLERIPIRRNRLQTVPLA
ncbi:MAG TPA: hypothetical protein VFZ01_16830 [Geminicoccaceae bacterium]